MTEDEEKACDLSYRIPGLEIEKVLASIKDLDDGKGVPLETVLARIALNKLAEQIPPTIPAIRVYH